jgi:DNA primase
MSGPRRNAPSRASVRQRRATNAARQEKLDEAQQRLREGVQALQTGPEWQRWLAVAARFPEYSFANTVLILKQRPDATLVAGYKAWQALGRQVSKGEAGIQLLAPMVRRQADANSAQDDHEGAPSGESEPGPDGPRNRLVGFRPVYVWDVAQTTGEPLPQPPAPRALRGEAPDGLWDTVAAEIRRQGFSLERGPTGSANGWTDARSRIVRVSDTISGAQAVRTQLHELGHVILHANPDADRRQGSAGVLPCRGVLEVEAESFAYLLATTHRIEADDYTFPYVATWASDVVGGDDVENVIRKTATRVLAAARRTLHRLDTGQAATAEAPHERLSDRATQGLRQARQLRERAEASARVASSTRRKVSRPLADVPPESIDGLRAVHTIAARFYVQHLASSWVPGYLAGRELDAVRQPPWHAGYAPRRWNALASELRRLGASDDLMIASGLVTRSRNGSLIDRFRDRLMLPLHADAPGPDSGSRHQAQVIGFIGRATPDADPDRTPKYLNSPDSPISRGKGYLYGLHEGRRLLARGARPVIVEGPLDAIAVTTGTRGRCVGLATCGSSITGDHLATLTTAVDLTTTGVVLATDPDPAGQIAAHRALLQFAARGIDPLAAALSPGLDPAALLQRQGPAALTAALIDHAHPLADDVILRRLTRWKDRLHWAEGRTTAIRDTAGTIAALPAPQADRQAQRVARYVGTDIAIVRAEIALRRDNPAPPGAAKVATPSRRQRAR